MTIQVFGAKIGEEELQALQGSMAGSWMGMGPRVAEFEQRLEQRFDKPFVLVNNGSNALHMAVKLLQLPPHSKIIVPSFTWASCASAILLEGHIPVFADSELDGNVSLRTIQNVLNKNVKAIMVVHYGGKPVRMAEIMSLGLPVIEDAAHAVDSMIGGQFCGTFGNIGVYSFDPIKNLATPDSGGLVISPELVTLSKTLRHCGIVSSGYDRSVHSDKWWEQDVEHIFPKYTPNDIAASIGLAQLKKLPLLQARRKQIWDKYQTELHYLPWLRSPPEPLADEQHSYFTYLTLVKDRDNLAIYLKNKGIYTTLRFHPLHKCSVYREYAKGDFPGCDTLETMGLNLPLHPRLSDEDVMKVIGAIREYA